jgi:hypothetical protein
MQSHEVHIHEGHKDERGGVDQEEKKNTLDKPNIDS